MRKHGLGWTLWLVAALAGCGGGDGNPMDGGPDVPNDVPGSDLPPGTPTVTASPDEGARGVLQGTSIVLAFSEPMNEGSVEAAWSSTSLPAGQIVFSWNSTSTILTVDASAVLMYPVGGLAVDRFGYEIRLDATAQDAEGDALAVPFVSTFETARDVTFTLLPVPPTGSINTALTPATTIVLRPGDDTANATWRAFVTFNLSTVPIIVDTLDVTFAARQQAVTGTPYAGLGNLQIEQIAEITAIDPAAVTVSALELIGDLSTTAAAGNPAGNRSIGASAALSRSLDASDTTMTFRLGFATAQDGGNDDDYVEIQEPTLTIHVLAE